MRRIGVFLLLLGFQWLLVINTGFSQSAKVTGYVKERSQSLPSANISLLSLSDSSLMNTAATDTAGYFSLIVSKPQKVLIRISFIGYKSWYRNIHLKAGDSLHLGIVKMESETTELKEIEVISEADPVVIKTDTTEFNAESFLSDSLADVSRLLKRIPGIIINRDGTVTVQGETVTRIFVDGKEFFGGNLEVILKNLPATLVNKVQVIDGKSEEAQFTGVNDGKNEKVINLTLKDENPEIRFGKIAAGAGTEDRYAGEGNINLFKGGNQFSILGMSNNINQAGPGFDEGTNNIPDAGGAGITSNHSGGINFFQSLGKYLAINGSYQPNRSENELVSAINRQYFQQDGVATYNEQNTMVTKTNAHPGTFGLDYDKGNNSIRLNTSFTLFDTWANGTTIRETYSPQLINSGDRNAFTENSNKMFGSSLFYGHRFRKKGRSLTMTGQLSLSENDLLAKSNSFSLFSDGNYELEQQDRNQQNVGLSYSGRITYTEPLGKRQFMQGNYNYSTRHSESNQVVRDFDGILIPEQSNKFNTEFTFQQYGLTYRYSGKKVTLSMGSVIQESVLEGRTEGVGESIRRKYQTILPQGNLTLKLNRSSRISLDYITSFREPSVNQLQPVVSRFDPLRQYVGNLQLQPEYTHTSRLSLNQKFGTKGVYILGNLTYNFTFDPIVPAITYDEKQVLTTQYINVNHKKNYSVYVTLGLPAKGINSELSFGPYFNQGESMNVLNGVEGKVFQKEIGGNAGYTFFYKSNVELSISAMVTWSDYKYEINADRSGSFITTMINTGALINFWKKYRLETGLVINRYYNSTYGFEETIPVLNCSLGRYFFKRNNGLLKISGVNLLDYNTGAGQFANENYTEQSIQNMLGRYVMASFAWTFKSSR